MLAGGTGGAALAAGFQVAAPNSALTVIANTADDDEFWGLLVCPDVDAVIYRLAGKFNHEAGYGVKDDTFEVLHALARAGEDAWFQIGDRDFATHLVRADMLRRGYTLTEATLLLCRRFGLRARVVPMTDGTVRTRFTTDAGELSFQEYFVRQRLRPNLRGIAFRGVDLEATIVMAQEMARRIAERLGAVGVNLLNSCGSAAWQTVFHFHLHVIPRYEDDPLRLPWTPAEGDPGEIEAAARELR